MTRQRRAVFLDRDGVINEPIVRDGKPYPPGSIAQIEIVPRAADDVRRLRAAGFAVLCVTNQPDVARGTITAATASAIMDQIANVVGLEEAFVCYHDDRDGCACRKPLPGLLLEGARRHSVALGASYMVGDRWKDIDAGAAAGCKTVLIDRNWPERGPAAEPDMTVASFSAAVDWIVKESARE